MTLRIRYKHNNEIFHSKSAKENALAGILWGFDEIRCLGGTIN